MESSKNYYIFVFISMIIFSCSTEPEQQSEEIDPLEGKILFSLTDDTSMVNRFSPYSTNLILLETEKYYGCANFDISTEITLGNNMVDILIRGIKRPQEMCLTAKGPAIAYKPINIAKGEYDLSIQYEKIIDQYKLNYSEPGVAVSILDTSFTHYILFNEW